jgi:hypothetical protein
MAEPDTTPTTEIDTATADVEGQYHAYEGSRIPWYVRLIWILFWVFAVYYVIKYLFPDLQFQFLNSS